MKDNIIGLLLLLLMVTSSVTLCSQDYSPKEWIPMESVDEFGDETGNIYLNYYQGIPETNVVVFIRATDISVSFSLTRFGEIWTFDRFNSMRYKIKEVDGSISEMYVELSSIEGGNYGVEFTESDSVFLDILKKKRDFQIIISVPDVLSPVLVGRYSFTVHTKGFDLSQLN